MRGMAEVSKISEFIQSIYSCPKRSKNGSVKDFGVISDIGAPFCGIRLFGRFRDETAALRRVQSLNLNVTRSLAYLRLNDSFNPNPTKAKI
jgi:hypothetical protein